MHFALDTREISEACVEWVPTLKKSTDTSAMAANLAPKFFGFILAA